MFKKVYLVSILMLLSINLNASTYDNDVLNIFSKIIPRMVLMSSELETLKESIEICIVHEKVDETSANLLEEIMHSNYPNGLKTYQLKITKTLFDNIEACKESHLTFMFNSKEENINEVIDYTKKYSILSVAYDARLLENGVDSSILIGRKVMPFINLKAIDNKGITLSSTLLQASKIYNEGEHLVYPFNTNVLRFSMTKH